MELFKLIIEDLIASDKIDDHNEYKIYSMAEFEDKEGIQKIYPESKFDKDFNDKDNWFRIEDEIIKSINDKDLDKFISENEDKLMAIHDKLAEENNVNNLVEVRTELLKEYVRNEDEIEDLEERELIYQDVNIESIAEVLTEVLLVDLKAQLGCYGSWQIINVDGMHYLLGN